MVKYFLFGVVCMLSVAQNSIAQLDTIKAHELKEVKVRTSPSPSSSLLTTSPVQTLSAGRLEKTNALQISDVLKHFSGVQVKDYAGVGGLKTVSIRSLGANHTNVIYDGIAVSDYQSGQINLGQFSIDNVEKISLYIGEGDPIFQTAQSQSLAGAIFITTQTDFPETDRKYKIKTAFKTGSFGLLNPSLWLGRKLNRAFNLSLSADYLKSDGQYPFTQNIGRNSIVHRKRKHSEVEASKWEANLSGKFRNAGNLLFKTYYYVSDQEVPGAATYYMDYSGESLYNRQFFVQTHYDQPLGKKVDFQANAKLNYTFTNYINKVFNTKEIHNNYDQRDYYVNTTFLYKLSDRLSFSWANDGMYGCLNTFPSRTIWLSALSGKYEIPSFRLTAKLLSTFVDNEEKNGKPASNYRHFSPYIGCSIALFSNIPVRFRAFYKNTFRLPAFGDMYYSSQPTADLKPENARQYNIGLTWANAYGSCLPFVSFTGDVYRNCIRNKIVAIPTNSMAIWSVLNYGEVDIQGMDLNGAVHLRSGSQWLWQIEGTYTYQNALNKTHSEPESYNKRIPYTSRHSATGTIGLQTPYIEFSYTILYCGKRYYEKYNYPESQMRPFMEHGIFLLRTFRRGQTAFVVTAECLNLFNEQYDVVHGYPMMGRSFRMGLKFNY